MKNVAKLIVVGAFGLAALSLFLGSFSSVRMGSLIAAGATVTPTPPANKPVNAVATPANTANTAAPVAPKSTAGGKTITKEFTLGKDSLSEWGEVAFNHETHAFKNYSPDGKSVVGCVECHHTDQPKSAMKPPLVTSERDVVLTMATYNASNQKVSECRACHFQEGNVPDDKEMPSATYTDGGKSTTKVLNNEIAYHINCNTCHDAAFKARPELKSRPGFATSKDCAICHKKN